MRFVRSEQLAKEANGERGSKYLWKNRELYALGVPAAIMSFLVAVLLGESNCYCLVCAAERRFCFCLVCSHCVVACRSLKLSMLQYSSVGCRKHSTCSPVSLVLIGKTFTTWCCAWVLYVGKWRLRWEDMWSFLHTHKSQTQYTRVPTPLFPSESLFFRQSTLSDFCNHISVVLNWIGSCVGHIKEGHGVGGPCPPQPTHPVFAGPALVQVPQHVARPGAHVHADARHPRRWRGRGRHRSFSLFHSLSLSHCGSASRFFCVPRTFPFIFSILFGMPFFLHTYISFLPSLSHCSTRNANVHPFQRHYRCHRVQVFARMLRTPLPPPHSSTLHGFMCSFMRVCMCVCKCVCLEVCLRVCASVSTSLYSCPCLSLHVSTSAYIYVYIYIYICVCIHVVSLCTCLRLRIYMYIYIYMCVYTRVYVCIYTQVYIYTIIYIHRSINMYIWIHIYIHIYILYIYIYVYNI